MKTRNNMNKKEAILDLDELTLEQIEFLRLILDRSFDITSIKKYRDKRDSESGPSTINYLKVPETLGEDLEIILGSNEEYEYLEFIDYIKKIRDLERGEKDTEGPEDDTPICGAEAKPDPDWILDTISYNSNYIKNMVKFFQGSGIKCEDYQEGNPYLIWNGYEAYFTPGFEEGCVAKTASDFVKDVMYTKLWPQIEAHLLGKPLESEQQHQVQPKQATLMDLARHMVIESQNQGIKLGIGEDGLFTFKVLMPQEQKNSL